MFAPADDDPRPALGSYTADIIVDLDSLFVDSIGWLDDHLREIDLAVEARLAERAKSGKSKKKKNDFPRT
jgi:hypothetical protein